MTSGHLHATGWAFVQRTMGSAPSPVSLVSGRAEKVPTGPKVHRLPPDASWVRSGTRPKPHKQVVHDMGRRGPETTGTCVYDLLGVETEGLDAPTVVAEKHTTAFILRGPFLSLVEGPPTTTLPGLALRRNRLLRRSVRSNWGSGSETYARSGTPLLSPSVRKRLKTSRGGRSGTSGVGLEWDRGGDRSRRPGVAQCLCT